MMAGKSSERSPSAASVVSRASCSASGSTASPTAAMLVTPFSARFQQSRSSLASVARSAAYFSASSSSMSSTDVPGGTPRAQDLQTSTVPSCWMSLSLWKASMRLDKTSAMQPQAAPCSSEEGAPEREKSRDMNLLLATRPMSIQQMYRFTASSTIAARPGRWSLYIATSWYHASASSWMHRSRIESFRCMLRRLSSCDLGMSRLMTSSSMASRIRQNMSTACAPLGRSARRSWKKDGHCSGYSTWTM
mmetsp:Transcript_29784/g.71023  ORF Transcript_29784/g.71023 Transcript_29784/m.71023 type:complete len:248 (-) Transcript_29784:678-1421(-)